MSKDSPIRAADHWFTGEDKVLRFSVVDSAGIAQDITGWTLEWILRPSPNATASLTKTTASGITITNAVGGVLEVAIADGDTDVLAAGLYVYALRRTNAGFETVLAYGDAMLQKAAAP